MGGRCDHGGGETTSGEGEEVAEKQGVLGAGDEPSPRGSEWVAGYYVFL